jgi:hypothetical protein
MNMPMHECFSGLFSASLKNGVARVSGVAPQETGRKINGMPLDKGQNTPRNTINGGVAAAHSATPAPAHGHGDGVAQENEEIQGDGARKTPVTPETPSSRYTGADFSNHAARFCALPCPTGYPAERWQQIQADAKEFAHLWGSQVSALGWNPDSVFAVPDGLIPLIEGGDILAVCEKTAVVRASNRKQFNTIRFKALPGEANPRWRVWASWCEP